MGWTDNGKIMPPWITLSERREREERRKGGGGGKIREGAGMERGREEERDK